MTGLNLRQGLPEHLRVLAEAYPRKDWEGHVNFNDLTRFWLDRHLMFRDVIGRLMTESQSYLDRPGDRFGAVLHRYTGFFLNQLHGHHGIEDHHYFPMLIGLDARVAPGFQLLDSDHKELDGHIHTLAATTNTALQALNAGVAKSEVDRLLAAQQAFERFLHRHLTDEEELVVPLILEYGPPDL